MRQECITKLKELNEKYIARYLGTSHVPNPLKANNSPIPHIDTANEPRCDLEYYDLMIVNLLMHRHYTVEYYLDQIEDIVSRFNKPFWVLIL